jgi:hypothetical protein
MPSFTSALMINTSTMTPPETYSITIRGAGGEKVHTVTLSLTLTPAPPSLPWGLVIGIIVVISVVVVVFFLYRRRRAAWTSG